MKTNYTIHGHNALKRRLIIAGLLFALLVLLLAGLTLKKKPQRDSTSTITSGLHFDASASSSDKAAISKALHDHPSNTHPKLIGVKTDLSVPEPASSLAVYVPVTNALNPLQQITNADLSNASIYIMPEMDQSSKQDVAHALSIDASKLQVFSGALDTLPAGAVLFLPADRLTPQVKLLRFNGDYYLDGFTKGAVFRFATFDGSAAPTELKFANEPTKETTLKVNMTGVTALTRMMMKKLGTVQDPAYFSQQIGSFLADADITHVSNEVSFKAGCTYSSTVFCAPPTMLEVLKKSGVDLVELTGNHNNDNGNQFNTETINAYHQLGWHTIGGGLNSEEASKPYIANMKGSQVAFLGYNYADSPGGGPIATTTTAGSNSFDLQKIKQDIESVHKQAKFAIVDVQFFECYAYPATYVEFPQCDAPIAKQKDTFRSIIDLGADMVIGTQAHQPQVYEFYKGKPIYYGLGNLYFDQVQQPGTERGIILTHYFRDGKLLQTKLSPTVYDQALQTHLMSNAEAVAFLKRLTGTSY